MTKAVLYLHQKRQRALQALEQLQVRAVVNASPAPPSMHCVLPKGHPTLHGQVTAERRCRARKWGWERTVRGCRPSGESGTLRHPQSRAGRPVSTDTKSAVVSAVQPSCGPAHALSKRGASTSCSGQSTPTWRRTMEFVSLGLILGVLMSAVVLLFMHSKHTCNLT